MHAAEPGHPGAEKAEVLIRGAGRAEVPYYASHELLSGRIRILCECHNVVLSATNPAEALQALSMRSPFEGRKKVARIQALTEALVEAFAQAPSGPRDQLKTEVLGALALKTAQLWIKSRNHNRLDKVQPLSCFIDGNLIISFVVSNPMQIIKTLVNQFR